MDEWRGGLLDGAPRMTDHFATLALPRRPWLEPEEIKVAFHRLAAERHPDSPGGEAEAFARTNAAWQILREPASRLRHLLALEFPALDLASTQLPPALADAFMDIAALLRVLEDFRRRKAAASGALASALLADDRGKLERRVSAALALIDAIIARAHDEVRTIDTSWPQRDDTTADRLFALQRELTFAEKWSAQLREGLFTLGG